MLGINLIIKLLIVLLVLILIKMILLKVINRKDLIIAKSIFTGNEEIQEDYLDVSTYPYGTLAVLSDGFGKNESGRIASIISVKTISKMFSEENTSDRIDYFFKKAYGKANKEILKRVERDCGGTSTLSVVIAEDYLNYALLGNAMLAVFRKNELIKLTSGHDMSEVAKKAYYEGKIEKSEALGALKEEKVLYYLGQPALGKIEMPDSPIKLEKNDVVVIMSKGIYKNLKWIEFEEKLKQKKMDLQELCDDITENVRYNNNEISNGSIILIKYCGKR